MSHGDDYGSIEVRSLPSQISAALRRSIFEGKLLPGAALREQHLAEKFGVSQNTVREALVQLQHVGLVQRLPKRASYVTKLSEEEIRERITVRLPLEQLACAEALRHMTMEDLEDIEKKAEIIQQNIAVNDYAGYCTADLEFHRATWRYARNRTLYKTLDQITAPLFAYLNMLQRDHAVVLSERTQPHKLITDAFRSNDSRQLAQIMEQHCGSTYGLLLEFFVGSTATASR